MDAAATTAFAIMAGQRHLPAICVIMYPYAGHIFTVLVYLDLFVRPLIPNYRAVEVGLFVESSDFGADD